MDDRPKGTAELAAERAAEHAAEHLAPWTLRRACDALLAATALGRTDVGPWPGPAWRGLSSALRDAKELAAAPAPAAWRQTAAMLGLRSGALAVLIGAPGTGKTGWAATVAHGVALRDDANPAGRPVVYASVELDAGELAARLLALRGSGAWWSSILEGRYHPDALAAACDALCDACPHLYVWAPTRLEERSELLFREVVHTAAAAGTAPPLVVVDYLQRLAHGEERREAVLSWSGLLRELARPDDASGYPGACVLCLSSTARDQYKATAGAKMKMGPWGDPEILAAVSSYALIGGGKESGEIEYDAGMVLALAVRRDDSGASKALVRCVKHRYGGQGAVWYDWNMARGTWTEGAPLVAPQSAPKPYRVSEMARFDDGEED